VHGPGDLHEQDHLLGKSAASPIVTADADRPPESPRSSTARSVPVRASRFTSLASSAAGCLIVGVCLAELKPPHFSIALLCLGILATLCWVTLTRWSGRRQLFLLLAACIALGATRAAQERETYVVAQSGWKELAAAPAVRVRGTVCSLPGLRTVPGRDGTISATDPDYRTAFLLHADAVRSGSEWHSMSGTLRVLVSGDATRRFAWGDELLLTGQLKLPELPLNPGERNFAEYARQQGTAATLFVQHPMAGEIVNAVPAWAPTRWLTSTRRNISRLLFQNLSSENRAIAEALLLGNRGFLSDGTEFAFISSGTMHLLAISGLHVGILYLFLVRLLLLLKCRHQSAQLTAFVFCVSYAFVTDLRPSVMRATLFIGLHVLAQQLRRPVSMRSLIAATVIIFVLYDPNVVFNQGAWLSFLAVTALSYVGRIPPAERGTLPPDAVTIWEDLRWRSQTAWRLLISRYRQMLAVSVATAPLIAAQFHVISAVALLVNVVLIPVTCGILIIGFACVAWGIVLPGSFQPLATVFDHALTGLRMTVDAAASVQLGSTSVMDCPGWLLLLFYLLLALLLLSRNPRVRLVTCCSLGVLFPLSLWFAQQSPPVTDPQITVLSVGHGNAVVMELPEGGVVLFDAGALNRAERTADIVCRFLWHRGHRMISAIVVSHPDLDHYNGVEAILRRLPVGQLIVSRQFVASSAPGVIRLLQTACHQRLPVTIAGSGDSIRHGVTTIEFLQANGSFESSSGQKELDDNDASLVCNVITGSRTITLPGDVAAKGQQALAEELMPCDVLVAPHHGSFDANQSETAGLFRPRNVIVSDRDADNLPRLRAAYGSECQLWHTAECGAVNVHIGPASVQVTSFRSRDPHRPSQ
jgi:competence protein ComEC